MQKLTWRIEGPFDSTYSLALVNREYAKGLDREGQVVSLFSSEGPGDFLPSEKFLADHDEERRLWDATQKITADNAFVLSRFMFPPRVKDMKGRVNMLHCYCWEETIFPEKWVKEFNEHLQLITTASQFVKDVLINSGVTVPILVVGLGVDHWTSEEQVAQETKDKKVVFNFLHVSSCFPRKGVDVLLKAYGEAFTSKDNVCLTVKTFDNPHNKIDEWLEAAKREHPDYPDVKIIKGDISQDELHALVQESDAVVYPSRGEGFGLPIAEAMLSKKAVISTAWSGQRMFVLDETSWQVDYDLEQTASHLSSQASLWAKPNQSDLASKMREVFAQQGSENFQARVNHAKELISSRFTWARVAKRSVDAVEKYLRLESQLNEAEIRLGWMTTWNTKCGIATYSDHLLRHVHSDSLSIFAPKASEHLPDGDNVFRCWTMGDDDLAELLEKIKELQINTLVIQFNYGFCDLKKFSDFVGEVRKLNVCVILFLHATRTPPHAPEKNLNNLKDALLQSSRVIVHTIDDVNQLKKVGIIDNVFLIPHGVSSYGAPDGLGAQDVIATYGFMLPHKGLVELIKAVRLLRDKGRKIKIIMVNALYPAEISRQYLSEIKKTISEFGMESQVELLTDFLPDEESIKQLQKASLIVFPYRDTSESASGALREGLASLRPCAVTPINIFSDVLDSCYVFNSLSVEDIAFGIEESLNSIYSKDSSYQAIVSSSNSWRNRHSFSRIGSLLSNVMKSLQKDEILTGYENENSN
jgi:glycosyltransferase involved in cell wall biosynthesis